MATVGEAVSYFFIFSRCFMLSVHARTFMYLFQFYFRNISDANASTLCDSVLDSYEEQEFWIDYTRLSLDWLNQFGMFEERFKLLSRWKQCGFKFETKGCLKTMNK